MNPPTVVGLGEILWDLLPSGRQLGGAPANFAYGSHLLGDRGIVASRIGRDQLGEDTRESLEKAGICGQFLQSDDLQPTGTARVRVDSAGQPKFEITQPAAWITSTGPNTGKTWKNLLTLSALARWRSDLRSRAQP